MTDQAEVVGDAPIALYRLFSVSGALLYVGITDNPSARFAEHSREKSWWPDVAGKTITWCDDRTAAEAAEDAAIKSEKPLHNIRGKGRRGVGAGGRGRHKLGPIPFRPPAGTDDREWLLAHAAETDRPVNAILLQALREYREKHAAVTAISSSVQDPVAEGWRLPSGITA